MTATTVRPRSRRLLTLATLFAVGIWCGLAPRSRAQTPDPIIKGIDAHVIFVQSPGHRGSGWKSPPTITAQAIRRYEAGRGRRFEETRSQSFGVGARAIRRLEFFRQGVGDQHITINWTIRAGSMTTSGGGRRINHDGRGDVMTFDHMFSFGRGSRNHGHRYVLLVPWTDPPEFEAWSAERYATWLAELCIARDDLSDDAGKALMHIPTQSLLDVKSLARLRKFAAEWEPDGRSGRRGGRHAGGFNQWRPAMRPEDIQLGVRLAAGDAEALDELRRRGNNWMLVGSVMLAYVQSGDPAVKGEAGWIMADPDGDPNLYRRSFIVPYFEAVEAGDAIIPGTDAMRTQRFDRLASLVAETDPTGALLVMLAAGAALVGVALAARRLALKLAI